MSTVFEYRHKKFDQRKRSREEDVSSTLPYSASSPVTIRWNAIPNPTPHNINKALTPKEKLKAKTAIDTELQVKMELIDLNNEIAGPLNDTTVILNPSKRSKLDCEDTTVNPAEDEIRIKMEIIDKLTALKRRRSQSKPIKTQQHHEFPIEIKEELIELNTTNVPAIPRDAFEEICKFRSNMVRKFPKKERSPKEQERRDKNTFACRRSRRVKKIEQVAVDEEYKGYKDTNLRVAEYAIRATAYFKELMNLTETAISDVIVID